MSLDIAAVLAVAALSLAPHGLTTAEVATPCTTDLSCSLNGVCTSGTCVCDAPWGGDACGVLEYDVTPAVAKSLYPLSDPRNTWNGPIIGPLDGKFHMFNPIYKVGSLGGAVSIMHGVSDAVEGPYNWDLPNMSGGINPAALVYTDPNTGKTVYSLWTASEVQVSDSINGPFTKVPGDSPGGNPAPLFHNGSFYATTQHTSNIVTSKSPGGPWVVHANISVPWVTKGRREDPFMWIDKRGHWHIINHAYDTSQHDHCGSSTLSAHQFSIDGIEWHMVVPNVEPYGHTVQYDDGTSHTYTTLERPSLHFDPTGLLTHINLATDMVTGDEGCAPTACTNCKYKDHAGTIVVKLKHP